MLCKDRSMESPRCLPGPSNLGLVQDRINSLMSFLNLAYYQEGPVFVTDSWPALRILLDSSGKNVLHAWYQQRTQH